MLVHLFLSSAMIVITRCLINITRKMHIKCRNNVYPGNDRVERFPVPDDKVSWSVAWTNYEPVLYTSRHILNQPWADADDFKPKWNQLDGKINRTSYTKTYEIVNGLPINPCGRTGIVGRGLLGRWGPNHAADPIVTRWVYKNGIAIKDSKSGKKLLQFVAIQRRDCKEWAIPGGMVDPGETISQTLLREFQEEAINGTDPKLTKFFETGIEIYKGYVDDPRNTDNAWMETIAMNFHDNDNNVLNSLKLQAGDDAQNVHWETITQNLNLYASHKDFIKRVADMHNAHW